MADRTIFDSYNPVTRRSTELVIDGETGLPLIVHTQDTKPIIEANKRQANNFDKYRARKSDFVHVARIDINTWRHLTALGITRDEKAFNAWLQLREASFYRVDDRRRL